MPITAAGKHLEYHETWQRARGPQTRCLFQKWAAHQKKHVALVPAEDPKKGFASYQKWSRRKAHLRVQLTMGFL